MTPFRLLRPIALSGLGGLVLWLAGFACFVWRLPAQAASSAPQTDAIVVLTGPERMRLTRGIDLFMQHRAPLLLISGVGRNTDLAMILREAHRSDDVLPPGAMLGLSARDTRGNAREAAAFVCAKQVQSLRLVTSQAHMPRALWLLRRALPASTRIVPDPIADAHGPETRLYWRRRWLEYNKDIIQHLMAFGGLLPPGSCPVATGET